MFENEEEITCTKCGSLYRSSEFNERIKARTQYAGLCENCINRHKSQAIDEALAMCSARMMVVNTKAKMSREKAQKPD